MVLTRQSAVRSPARSMAAQRVLSVLRSLFGDSPPFTVRLWDGTCVEPAGPSPFTLLLSHPGALRRMLLPPTELALGEAYVRGDFDVEGDLEAAIDAAVAAVTTRRDLRAWMSLAAAVLALPKDRGRGAVPRRAALRGRLHSLERDRAAVRHHYDVGNEFWQLWLDRRMVYSCAYFPTGSENLDTAQEAKLELICRKLRLRSDERLLDVGCGWGGLIVYAAEHHGVRAVGITLSEPQARYARARIAAAGLTERCRVEVRDYREFDDRPFDKIASVGMFEHVGRARLRDYYDAAFRLLRPGGLLLNHGITRGPLAPRWPRFGPRANFINAHVFPDGELVTVGDALAAAEAAGFEVRDGENLREHYVRTLQLWGGRLQARRDEAVRAVGEGKYRTWRLFMAGSAQGFATGRTSVFQALLARPEPSGAIALPWSRADLYV